MMMTREEFSRQVKATQEAFRRFLAALCCGDIQLADDIAQDAYVKAYLSVDSLRDPGKFQPWLYRIGYRLFLNHRQSGHRHQPLEEATAIESEQQADARFRYEKLYDALEQIPRQRRTAILLFYMQGYSAAEIAEITDTTPGAARQLLARGRHDLETLLTSEQNR